MRSSPRRASSPGSNPPGLPSYSAAGDLGYSQHRGILDPSVLNLHEKAENL